MDHLQAASLVALSYQHPKLRNRLGFSVETKSCARRALCQTNDVCPQPWPEYQSSFEEGACLSHPKRLSACYYTSQLQVLS
jgi:hypothetical protein